MEAIPIPQVLTGRAMVGQLAMGLEKAAAFLDSNHRESRHQFAPCTGDCVLSDVRTRGLSGRGICENRCIKESGRCHLFSG